MATTLDIAHRWANQQFGKRDGTLIAGNTHCDEISFYSYSTVIAQWLDKKRKIIAVLDIPLTQSTGAHISNVLQAIPCDVTVFRLHRSKGYGYANVDFCNWRGELDPMTVTEQYVNLLFGDIVAVDNNNSLNPGSLHWWHELQRWEKYFPGGSVKKYLRQKLADNESIRKQQTEYRKMLRALLNGATFEEIVDVVNGEGAWQRYLDRTKGVRKTRAKRDYANKIAQHIGYGCLRNSPLTSKELLALTPLQRVEIKLNNVVKPSWTTQSERKARPVQNLLKFLGIAGKYYPSDRGGYFNFHANPTIIHDPRTGELIYDSSRNIDWRIPEIYFKTSDIEKVKKNPKKFREWFLAKARALGRLHIGNQYLYRKDDATPEHQEMIAAYLNYKKKHDARAKTRRDRYEAERRRQAEEAAEKARQRQLIVQSYQERGIDGYRDLWRERFDQRPDTASFNDTEFFYGGNVLLRYNEQTQMVETSKSIRLNLVQAKKLWRTIEIWHQNPNRFQRIEIKTQNSSYTVHSYKNDILIAGCHSIAYSEIARMAHQLNFV